MKKLFLTFLITLFLFNFSHESDSASLYLIRAADRLDDEILLNEKQISDINQRIRKKGLVIDPFNRNLYCSKAITRRYILADLSYVTSAAAWDADNKYVPKARRTAVFKKNLNLPGIRTLNNRQLMHAVVKRPTPLRFMPSPVYRMQKKDDFPFDVLQLNMLNIWDPVTITHTSTDRAWYYVETAYTRGWVQAADVAILPEKIIRHYLDRDFIVITQNRVKITDDENGKYFWLYLGDTLPIQKEEQDHYIIEFPDTKDGRRFYRRFSVSKGDGISKGYLDITRKNIARIAFRMIGEKYSWGEYDGNTDCSGFLNRLYSVFGLKLPRSSRKQMKIFPAVPGIRKDATISSLEPYLTFLQVPGHIMLYIGSYNGRHYVIHNVWKYYTPENEKIIIGKVTVTSLDLGAGSQDGSLKDRLKAGMSIKAF